MDFLKSFQNRNLLFGIPLLIVLIAIGIGISPLLQTYPDIAIGLTYDLVLTAPLAYFLIIRKRKIPKITIVPVFVLGMVIASYLLPEHLQNHLNFIKTYFFPLVEILVLGVLIYKIRQGINVFKAQSKTAVDFYDISKASAQKLFGEKKFASFFASEISMFYYGIFAWRFKKLKEHQFSNYKDNASIAMGGALLMVVFIETFAFHSLLQKWNLIVAWILTGSSIYTALLIIAHLKALVARPSLLLKDKLVLKNGLIADIHIPLKEIDKVVLCSKEMESSDIKIANLGLSKKSTQHNIALYFKSPQTIQKMYGFTETCDILLFHIDGKTDFVNTLDIALKKSETL